ncbi:hypothetical protein BDQ12DRAFT_676416 [Crucibulum laeve]|uniref:Phorbol-ester/DAG-type domain-containing protein n=1 Tax=Crucibulum laeve TaxID=68775 RepID=A0A5C3MFB8_9AGAR|nr:hypothetical protein BDQ12DRAFT_676416 [Crucibulum laeve]
MADDSASSPRRQTTPRFLDTDFQSLPQDDHSYFFTPPTPIDSIGKASNLSGTPRLSAAEVDESAALSTRSRAQLPVRTNNRAKNESRKLLLHVLNQLQNRPRPPSVSDTFSNVVPDVTDKRFDAFVGTVKDAVKLRSNRVGVRSDVDDSDEEIDQSFSTDTTFDLMVQLKDVLNISVVQGWHIFDDGSSWHEREKEQDFKPSSPFRRSRNSFQSNGRRSRSSSPVGQQVQVPELLSVCIAVLASIVLQDCRFQMSSPRPSRPPNALQMLTLNVAQFLVHIHRYDPKIISQIAFAMIPAFSTFRREMYAHLLSFFEDGVMRGALQNLRSLQGLDDAPVFKTTDVTDTNREDDPIVSIQVDEVQDDNGPMNSHIGWKLWTSDLSSFVIKTKSTNAPLQSMQVYHLAALVPSLLSSILGCVDIDSSPKNSNIVHRFQRLISLISDLKVDVCMDLLQIVAYQPSKSRRLAASLLVTLWPKATGHLTIARPLSPVIHTTESNAGTSAQWHSHQFVPWFFAHGSHWPRFNSDNIEQECDSCAEAIRGFGILCPFCMCSVHFDCYDYPSGNYIAQYSLESDPHVQRVAVYRYSNLLPVRADAHDGTVWIHKHSFKLVNIFTLCLCFVCRKPLWGCIQQGLKCDTCLLFVHHNCLSNIPSSMCGTLRADSRHVNIDWSTMRQSCLDKYPDLLMLNREELTLRSYEELSILRDLLATELQILTNGIALGSIVVTENGRNSVKEKIKEFELQRTINWCHALLSSGNQHPSLLTNDYLRENHLSQSEHSIMFDWSNLTCIASTIRLPFDTSPIQSRNPSSQLLNVIQPGFQSSENDASAYPFEAVSVSHMRDVLGHELGVHSETIAQFLLRYLHHLAHFDKIDPSPQLFADVIERSAVCKFPFPSGFDPSVDVETLVAAVEASLCDLDLSVNEFGFLLLARKLWPNGLTSEYGLRRLSRAILSWILAEDDSLAVVLREYVAERKALPGVKVETDSKSWPLPSSMRSASTISANNGGDYLAGRRSLLSRYATRWLQAIHNHDSHLYTNLIYEVCVESAEQIEQDKLMASQCSILENNDKKSTSSKCDNILRFIMKFSQSSVTFGVFGGLFMKWIEFISVMKVFDMPMPSLYRMMPRESEVSILYNGPMDQPAGATVQDDFWHTIMDIAAQSKEGLTHGLQWLCTCAKSGMDISGMTFMRFSSMAATLADCLPAALLLTDAVMSSVWMKSIGRQELQLVFSSLHSRLASELVACLNNGHNENTAISIIRKSLAACLLLYGCERSNLLALEMIKEYEVKDLPSRRKLSAPGSQAVDPIVIDQEILDAIQLYATSNVDEVSCLIAKFLNSFISDSPLLEAYEIDNFILRNGHMLATCAWQFYGIQSSILSNIRINMLLRTLIIDGEPFHNIVHESLLSSSPWQHRLSTVTRLFRILLDITSPIFVVEGRQWRSSLSEVFCYFFNTIWSDPREEVRLAASTFSATLLPAHREAVTLCWDESIRKSPIAERIRLVSFLIQLHSHFPGWRVLSWSGIVESLFEYDYDEGSSAIKAALSSTYFDTLDNGMADKPDDSDTGLLRISIMLLSLQMVAAGVTVDSFTLMKLKIQFVRLIGFSDVSVVPSSNGQAFYVHFSDILDVPESTLPCIDELVTVLDTRHLVELPSSVMGNGRDYDERSSHVLVGSAFVDVSLTMLSTMEELQDIPAPTLKSLLEGLYIIIYKYDFESRMLGHLQPSLRKAVSRVLGLLLQDISYELRHLVLSIIQAFVKRWHSFMGSIIYNAVENVAELVASQTMHSQDVLPSQGRAFLETTLQSYSNNGLFMHLLKRTHNRQFFTVLAQILTDPQDKHDGLRERLLRDTTARIVDCDPTSLQGVLVNLQTYVEVVYHEGYSADLMIFMGQHFSHISRRLSDWSGETIDPSPLLTIFAILLHDNRKHSREILPYVDTVLRVTLNRLHVTSTCLKRLLEVTTTLSRKNQAQDPATPVNGIMSVIYEILGDALRIKARVQPSTLKAMLDALTSPDTPDSFSLSIQHPAMFLGLAENGFHFLQNHSWLDSTTEHDFGASLAVARLVFQAGTHDPSVIRILSSGGTDRLSRHITLSVRSWNILVLAALKEHTQEWATMLTPHLPVLSNAYFNALRTYIQGGFSPSETTMTDINHAYIAIKLWLMLVQKASTNSDGELAAFSVWNELWPPFECLVNIVESVTQPGLSSPLAALTTSSVAELFTFLRTLHTPLALQVVTYIATLQRLRAMDRGESTLNKLNRTLKSVSEPPIEVSFTTLLDQTSKEIIATEKLRLLETKRDPNRSIPEKRG